MPAADASDGRRRSPSIKRTVWPDSEAVMARQEATVVLPSFGCVLVTKSDLPEPKGPLSRIPLRSASYAFLSSGRLDTMRANALKRCPSLARVSNNSLAVSIPAPRLWQAGGESVAKPRFRVQPVVRPDPVPTGPVGAWQ